MQCVTRFSMDQQQVLINSQNKADGPEVVILYLESTTVTLISLDISIHGVRVTVWTSSGHIFVVGGRKRGFQWLIYKLVVQTVFYFV